MPMVTASQCRKNMCIAVDPKMICDASNFCAPFIKLSIAHFMLVAPSVTENLTLSSTDIISILTFCCKNSS